MAIRSNLFLLHSILVGFLIWDFPSCIAQMRVPEESRIIETELVPNSSSQPASNRGNQNSSHPQHNSSIHDSSTNVSLDTGHRHNLGTLPPTLNAPVLNSLEHSRSNPNGPNFGNPNPAANFEILSNAQPNSWSHLPPRPGFDPHNQHAGMGAPFGSQYDPRQIDAARRTAAQYQSSLQASPVVADLAKTNASFIEQWADLADRINSLSGRVFDANTKLQSAVRDFEDVDAKLRQQGLTPTIGLLLSHKKDQLEDWQIDGAEGHCVNDEIQQSRSKQLNNQAVIYDGSDIARQSAAILASAGVDSTRVENSMVASQVQSALRERSHWLQMLNQGYNDHRQKLGELDSASSSFDRLISDYRQLIYHHVTWIRNNDAIGIADVRKLRTGVSSLFDARRLEDFGFSLQRKWKNNPASGLMLFGSISFLFLIRIITKHWLLGIGKGTRLQHATSTVRKGIASVLTPIVAVCLPSILYLVARWLGSGFVTMSTLHASNAMYAASLVALIVEVPRQLLRTHGFVEKHLHVDLPRRGRAMGYLRVIGFGLVVSAYIVTLAEQIDHGTWNGSVARFAFILSILVVAWTAHLALKPADGFLEPLVEKFGGKVFYRVRWVFYLLGVGSSLAMIALSALGYSFTTTVLIQRTGLMLASILVGLTLWPAVKIVASWAWHSLTGTDDASLHSESERRPKARVTGALAEHALELKHQLAFLSQCALVLGAFACIGWLWFDILPNLQMANPTLWTVQDTITQSFLDPMGQKVSRSNVESTPVTLLHVLLACATLFVAFQLAKLLPAIFDVLVLQRVNFDEAMEHLSLVVGRLVLFGAGCFIACRLVGLRWETLQWPAVGLAVGLGFAMQDILRNLFGGLIVLFEKPARLGDLITVGKVTGRVSSQKLRTTLLSDDEGREVIVPNKNFVSEDVVHWMGAGRLQAIPIEVAVTRDERPADVCRMLQHFLVEQPELLLSPAPQATLICVSKIYQRIELMAWVEDNHLDAARYRDTLTKKVVQYLSEKNMLSPRQPRQPDLKEIADRDSLSGNRLRNKRTA